MAFVSSFVPRLAAPASRPGVTPRRAPRRAAPAATASAPGEPAHRAGDATPATLSRRGFCAAGVAAAAAAALGGAPGAARADALPAGVAGQVVQYRDLPKGFTILRPSGWNEFEGLQDSYDIKWQDVIQPLEFVTVLTTPVAAGKQLSDLGDAQAVGSRLAASRGGELLDASVKDIDGVPAYVVEIKREKSRQITLLAVAKMKLYSVNASCSTNRWSRREKLLRAVVDSFKPKL